MILDKIVLCKLTIITAGEEFVGATVHRATRPTSVQVSYMRSKDAKNGSNLAVWLVVVVIKVNVAYAECYRRVMG